MILTQEDYDALKQQLGHEPTDAEILTQPEPVQRTEPDEPTYDINTPEDLGVTLAEVEADHPLLAPLLRARTVNKPKGDG